MYSRPVGRALGGLGALLFALIVACWHHRGGLAVDHWVAARLAPVAAWALPSWLRHATDPWYVLMVAWVLALRHELDGRRRTALTLVVPVVAALAVTELVLKPGVDARAASGAWTFPSGNVTGAAALLMTVYWVEARHRPRTRGRVTALAALACVMALSSLAIVAYRIHFFTDAVGAVCVGVGVPLALLGSRRTRRRRRVESRSSYPGGAEKA